MLDISLSSARERRCDGTSRRNFLRIGAISALGLSLPQLLARQAAAGEEGAKAKAKSVVLIYLGGGLSHHDSFDPKPDAPAEIRGKYKTISTNVPGTLIGELL